MMDDLNMRNDPLPSIVEKYWDFEGKHRLVVLDEFDNVVQFIETPSHRAKDAAQTISTKSYCLPKNAGEKILFQIKRDAKSTDWWMEIN